MGAAIQAGAFSRGEVDEGAYCSTSRPCRSASRHRAACSRKHHREEHHHSRHQERRSSLPPRTSQDVVRIHVLQGEREMAVDNMTLGRFELLGIPPDAARRSADRGGVRHRHRRGRECGSAKDLGTGKSQSIRGDRLERPQSEDAGREQLDEPRPQENSQVGLQIRRALTDLSATKADGLIYSTERTLEGVRGEHRQRRITRPSPPRWPRRPRAAIPEADDCRRPSRLAVDELSGLTYQMTEKLYSVLGDG